MYSGLVYEQNKDYLKAFGYYERLKNQSKKSNGPIYDVNFNKISNGLKAANYYLNRLKKRGYLKKKRKEVVKVVKPIKTRSIYPSSKEIKPIIKKDKEVNEYEKDYLKSIIKSKDGGPGWNADSGEIEEVEKNEVPIFNKEIKEDEDSVLKASDGEEEIDESIKKEEVLEEEFKERVVENKKVEREEENKVEENNDFLSEEESNGSWKDQDFDTIITLGEDNEDN